jgi:hypothetical protein
LTSRRRTIVFVVKKLDMNVLAFRRTRLVKTLNPRIGFTGAWNHKSWGITDTYTLHVFHGEQFIWGALASSSLSSRTNNWSCVSLSHYLHSSTSGRVALWCAFELLGDVIWYVVPFFFFYFFFLVIAVVLLMMLVLCHCFLFFWQVWGCIQPLCGGAKHSSSLPVVGRLSPQHTDSVGVPNCLVMAGLASTP